MNRICGSSPGWRCLFLLPALLIALSSCRDVPFFAEEESELVLTCDRTTLKTGGDRAIITIIGFTSDGLAMRDHTTVLLTATLGTVPASVELMGGRATVEFLSGQTSGIGKVQAVSGLASGTSPDILIGQAAMSTLTLAASPSSLGVGGGRVTVVATVRDAEGNPLSAIPVKLSTTAGTFELGGGTRSTDAQGQVSDTLQTAVNATIRAEAGNQSKELEIKVTANTAPMARFYLSPSTTVKIGETVYFDGSPSFDSDGRITDYRWEFGDGSSAHGIQVRHAFTRVGSFQTYLRVTDDQGATGLSDAKSITVASNALPTAAFAWVQVPPNTDHTLRFDAGSSSDSDGTIVRYEWNFGDGTSGTGITPSHTYDAAGHYTVLLTVTDNLGGSNLESAAVIVADI